ncbi:hypothetical protein UlMin_022420 [Ulmus minor]
MKNDLLFYKGRLVLPKPSKWITRLLHEFHDSLVGGHSGFFRTLKRMSGNVFWQGMKKDIRDYVAECEVCQKSKNDTLSPAGLLQPLPIPALIWEDISIDFVGGLPKSKGIDTILVVVDRLSKYAHFCPLVHPFTAKQVAELFAREIVRLHGFPRSIVSDRDPIFMSGFWKELFKLQGSKLHHSSAYHPQSNGQTEVVNRCLESYLCCFASDKPKSWRFKNGARSMYISMSSKDIPLLEAGTTGIRLRCTTTKNVVPIYDHLLCYIFCWNLFYLFLYFSILKLLRNIQIILGCRGPLLAIRGCQA